MKAPELIGPEEIGELLDLSNSSTAKDIIEPIKHAMDLFEKNISTMAFLPSVSRVTWRIATLQYLLEEFRNEIKGKRFEQVLEKAGEMTGESFASDLMDFLSTHNKLAKSERVLLDLWKEFDTLAGWGRFEVVEENDQIIVEVKDSFLTRELNGEVHRNCAFMKGYIKGFLWTALKEHYRLFGRLVVKPSKPPRTVHKITSGCGAHTCRFVVHLREEQLQSAFDNFYASKAALRDENANEASKLLRTSIELALKEKVGVDKRDLDSVLKILDVFKERKIQLRYNIISNIYASTSGVVHGSHSHSNEKVADLQAKWYDILKELELLEI